MSATQVRASAASNVMKFEGHSNINGIITQTVGREPFLSIAYTGDNASQWIHLLNIISQGSINSSRGLEIENTEPDFLLAQHNGVSPSLANGGVEDVHILKRPEAVVSCTQPAARGIGQPDKCHPGWPLLTPSPRSSIQMHKCSRCSKEFCSIVNYKRHIRVHRRSLVIQKASPRSRELLGAFWDSLSLDAIKELVSLDTVKLENVDGSSFVSELRWVGKLSFIGIPQDYIKAGTNLLDIIQATSSVYPIQSHDLFRILDDASERTFLCAGSAISLQKLLFDKETLGVSLDSRNIIACVSFLLEQKLVKAWIVKKDAEALRCQMLLVEEEEAAQRRQAALSEKRRLKKLKQKEHKSKEVNKSDFKEGSPDSLESSSSSEETSTSMLYDLGSRSHNTNEIVIPNLKQRSKTEVNDVYTFSSDQCSQGNVMEEPEEPVSWKHVTVEETQETEINGVYVSSSDQCNQINFAEETQEPGGWRHATAILRPRSQSSHYSPSVLTKHSCFFKDTKSSSASFCQKVWTQKAKNPTELRVDDQLDARKEANEKSLVLDQSSVLIGSMTVSLNEHDIGDNMGRLSGDKGDKPCCTLNNITQSTVGLHRRQYNGNTSLSERRESDPTLPFKSGNYSLASSEGSTICNDEASILIKNSNSSPQPDRPLSLLFSRKVAEDFLKQRWEEAVASEHLNIDSSCDSQSQDSCCMFDDDSDQSVAPNCSNRGILGIYVKPKARITATGTVGVGVYKIKHNFNKEKVQVR